MREAVIVSGARTAIGGFGGALKDVAAIDLAALVIKQALKRVNLRPAPSADMQAAAPDKLKSQGLIELEKKAADWDAAAAPVAVDEVVLKAIALGASAIMTGQADVVVAGGMENMSLAPMAMTKARWGYRMELTGKGEVLDLMVFDGLYEIFYGYHMGVTAENIASLYGISRAEQDELGVLSHTRAMAAIKAGWFDEEIVPVVIKDRKGDIVVKTDERPMETSLEKMGKLRPAFKADGSVTAGNASGINDGAAAVLIMSAEKAKALGLTPFVKIKAFASGALDPAYMGLGPVPAVRQALKQAGMQLADIDMIELNEAFAAQAIGCMRELGLKNDRPNEVGSGISLGHPIGATGARQMVTAIHHMRRKGYRTGLISMCIGGGMGMAMIVER